MPAIYPTLRAAIPQPDLILAHTIPISDVTELQNMNNNVSGNYYLTCNIDASATSGWNAGAGFVPIAGQGSGTEFSGSLDGCGFTITGLTINRPTESKVGLFGKLGAAGKVSRLTLASVNIIGLMWVGALAGCVVNSGGALQIRNCHSSGSVTLPNSASAEFVGGLLGWVENYDYSSDCIYIDDCSSSCIVTNNRNSSSTGGLIGRTWAYISGREIFVRNCYATGNVTSNGSQVGGLIGSNYRFNIVFDCHATGDVSGVGQVGGFCGDINYDNIIARCYATGNVVASVSKVGGFTSHNDFGSSIQDCYSTGNVNGGNQSGGFAGEIEGPISEIDRCYSIGIPMGVIDVGGFCGDRRVGGIITDCFWDTDSSGTLISDGGTGETTGWFANQVNYPPTWDFVTVWYLPALPVSLEGTVDFKFNFNMTGLKTKGCQLIKGKPRSSYIEYGKHVTNRNVYL